MLFLLVAASPIAACVDAVHGGGSVETACAAPRDDLWSGGLSPACLAALSAGRAVPRNLPPVMRSGVVREFDAKATACVAGAPPPKGRTTAQRLGD